MTRWNCWMGDGAACQAADSIPPIYVWSVEVTHYQGELPLLYIFVSDVVTGGEISRVGAIGCSSLCHHKIDMRPPPPHALTNSHLQRRQMVKGGELKEQTRRQWPLTDLTSVIGVLRCQSVNQIKMNGAYPGHRRLASLGPISSAPITVHIERLIERLTMPLWREETQAHTNRFLVDRRGGVIRVVHDRKNRWKHLRGGLHCEG